MKKLLAFLTFLLFLLLIWLSWNWYRDTVVCCDEPVVKETTGVLYYDCNSELPKTTDGWTSKKEEILAAKPEGKKLLIVAPYFDGEDQAMGLKRAENVKKLFLDKLSSDDIVLDSRPAGDCKEGLKDIYDKTLFNWVVRNENVVEYQDKAYIYFKYNSTKEIDSEYVVKYLNALIEQLKGSDQTVTLTGHTDADGTVEYNYKLGMDRAKRVKKYLVKHGVPEEKITVKSKGKTEPLDTNGTPEGKQKNRRVEIQVK
ncbi:MAG: hypothetical protein DSY82_04035 [Flavobacteriia bacterium]|nr:MAG: hypothetical protein DSY82_04035 [Flavobacteriia bacterium]